jgi:hypothetical protein
VSHTCSAGRSGSDSTLGAPALTGIGLHSERELRHLVARSLRFVADLAGHHSEAAAGLPGAGGLDGRIQRQQVGLPGDGVDQSNNIVDFGGGAGEATDAALTFPNSAHCTNSVTGTGSLRVIC